MLHAQIKLWRQQKVRRSSDIWIKKQKVTSEEDNPVKAPGNNTFWCLSKRSQQIWNKQKITAFHHRGFLFFWWTPPMQYLEQAVQRLFGTPLPLVLGKFPEMSSCWHLITCIAAKLTGCKKQLILLKISKTVLECQTFHQPMISRGKCFWLHAFLFLRWQTSDQRGKSTDWLLIILNFQPTLLCWLSGICF